MLERMKQFYQLFKEGQQVSDPAFWHKGQAYVQPIVAGLIMALVALAKGFGYELPVSDNLAYTLAGALFFTVNSVLTIISSKHVGIKPSMPQAPVREAQPPMPSVQQADAPVEAADETEPVPPIDQAPAGQPAVDTIDEATRQRAREWVRLHSASIPSVNNSNGLANDA